jgi:hypothetical protein
VGLCGIPDLQKSEDTARDDVFGKTLPYQCHGVGNLAVQFVLVSAFFTVVVLVELVGVVGDMVVSVVLFSCFSTLIVLAVVLLSGFDLGNHWPGLATNVSFEVPRLSIQC